MNNKTKTPKQGLQPKLRFPEFRDAGDWEEEKLEKLYSFKSTNSLSREKLTMEKGNVKNIHYGDIHTKFSTNFDIEKEDVPYIVKSESLEKAKPDSFCVKGDVIFADASEDMDDIGKSIEIVNLNNEKVLSGLHTILARQKKDILKVGFAGHLFQSPRLRAKIQKEAQGAKVLGISGGRLASIDVCFPTDRKEQKKIANCLSSLDELIEAEGQKLDALQRHKKGLIREIFPAEGKTLPKLRFPEFRDAPEWEPLPLGKKVDFLSGYPFDGAEISENKHGIRLLRGINVTEGRIRHSQDIDRYYLGNTDKLEKYKIQMNDLVIPMDGSKVGKNSALVTNEDSGALLVQRVARLRSSNDALIRFIYQQISSSVFHCYVDKINTSSGIPHISAKQICEFEICFPDSKELQFVADFLSSIDDLITAQNQKLTALKAHKKGLMQQLFPATSEV